MLHRILALLALLVPPALAQQSALVIVLDDVGAEDIAAVPTPTIDALASVGRTYTSYYTTTICSPSRYQLLVGQLPHREFVGSSLATGSGNPDDEGVATETLSMATVARANGFRTALFGKWHLNDTTIGCPEEMARLQGFQHWLAGSASNNNNSHYNWVRIDDGVRSIETTYSTIAVEDAFETWWKANPGPRLAFVCYQAPHAAFQAPPASLLPPGYVVGPTARDMYEAALVGIDTAIAQMAAYVNLANTAVFVVSDNGTPPQVPPPGGQHQGYKLSQYEGGIRVPMWAVGPGIAQGVTTDLVQAVDVPTTILDLLGLAHPVGFQDSISAVATLQGGGHTRPWVFLQRFTPNGGTAPALTRDDWALVWPTGTKVLVNDGNPEEVYDVLVDPFETTDLAGTAPGMQAILDALALRTTILGPGWPY